MNANETTPAVWELEAENAGKSWSIKICVNIACDPSDWGDCGEGYEYDGDEDDRQSAYEHECSYNFAQMYAPQIQEIIGELGFEFDECECDYYHAPCRTGFDSAEIYLDNVAVYKTNSAGVKKRVPARDFENFLADYIKRNIDDDEARARYMRKYH
jgi:hypothetical protein